MFIMGIISSCTGQRVSWYIEPSQPQRVISGLTTNLGLRAKDCSNRKVQVDCQKCRSTCYFMSRFVCAKAFVWQALRFGQALQNQWAAALAAGGGGQKNTTTSLALMDTERAVRFIKQYAETRAVSLPGRVSGFKSDICLLPSSCPKSQVYRLLRSKCQRSRTQHCGYVNLQEAMAGAVLLSYCCCWCRQQNATNIYRSANLTLEEKGELLQEHAAHLSQVDAEWQFYKQQIVESKECVQPTHRTLQCTTPLTLCQRSRTQRCGCIDLQEAIAGAVLLSYCCCQTCDGPLQHKILTGILLLFSYHDGSTRNCHTFFSPAKCHK